MLVAVACADDAPPPVDAAGSIDAARADARVVADAAGDAPIAACTGSQAAALITSYCTAGFVDSMGAACVDDLARCESQGEFERTNAERLGCTCYLCPLYTYVNENEVCATNDLAAAYNLEQCFFGVLNCP